MHLPAAGDGVLRIGKFNMKPRMPSRRRWWIPRQSAAKLNRGAVAANIYPGLLRAFVHRSEQLTQALPS
jgi:hypothetical protein